MQSRRTNHQELLTLDQSAPPLEAPTYQLDAHRIESGLVAVIIPAYNEAAQIVSTIESVFAQTRAPDRVIVVANNCTDNTAVLARQTFATVIDIGENPYNKAGAQNRGLHELLMAERYPEFILTIDADTVLDPSYIERSIAHMQHDPKLGGLGAVCVGKSQLGTTPWQKILAGFQRMEYARAGAIRLRRNIHTLPGAGCFLRTTAVLDVLKRRSRVYWQDPHNIVEDFTLTLELKANGWRCTNNVYCLAYTDLMLSVHDLLKQRCRWIRGTWDELRRRGWQQEARVSWLVVLLGYLLLPVFYLWPVLIIEHMAAGQARLQDYALWPLFGLYQAVTVRRLGWKFVIIGFLVLPEVLYGLLRHYWLVKSLWMSLTTKHQRWR